MAHVMMTRVARWFPLKPWAMRVAARRGAKRAKVALARRLAVVLHRMWLDGTDSRRNRYDSGAACDPFRRGKNPVGTKAEGKPLDTSAPPRRRLRDGLPPPTPIASGERGTTPSPRITDRSQRLAGVPLLHTTPGDRRCPSGSRNWFLDEAWLSQTRRVCRHCVQRGRRPRPG
jgi:hypothetical protein